jgi:1-phosphofructokinase
MSQDPSGRVVIFEPSPLFTVTIESDSGRTPEVHFHLGGQGAWVGRTIRVLGGTAIVCGPIGGESGTVLRALAEDERTGVPLRTVACANANGGYVHDRRSGGRDEIVEIPAPALTRHEADDLYNVTLEEAARSSVLMLCGRRHEDVIPIGVYERLPHDAAELGCKIVADLDGETARACGEPIEVLKVAHNQLLPEGVEETEQAIRKAMLELRERGAQNIVVSRGADPILALIGDEWFEVDPPKVQELDHRGAGDSMTGTLAYCVAAGVPLVHALQLATAAGASSVTRHGHASGLPATVAELAKRVEVRRIG